MVSKLCEEICAGTNVRENLIQLNQIVKDEAFLDCFLDEYYENEAVFMGLLDNEDAKVRKNIIKLLGRVADQVLMEPLFEHYLKEETQFLKSDYLSALAEFEYKKYLPELKERWKELSNQEMTKHSQEEMKQLKKLIWKIEPPKRHTFNGYSMENKLLFIVSRGHEADVLKQMEEIPETSGKTIPGGCLVTTKQLEEVCKIRTFQAVLFDFYREAIHSKDGKEIGEKILNAGMTEYIQKRHKEETPFLFRVEVKGVKDISEKNRLAKDLSEYLEKYGKGKMINEPSFYEIEVRVIVGSKGSRIFLKLTCLPDERFSYRKYVTSSSMHPTKAALAIHYALPYLRADANILDPFAELEHYSLNGQRRWAAGVCMAWIFQDRRFRQHGRTAIGQIFCFSWFREILMILSMNICLMKLSQICRERAERKLRKKSNIFIIYYFQRVMSFWRRKAFSWFTRENRKIWIGN